MIHINRKQYNSPHISVWVIVMEESIAAGSAQINTGWGNAGDENAPKETQWETGWNTGPSNFDM